GATGDDLTKPIRVAKYAPDTTCEIDHHGDICGRGKDDGNGTMSRIVVNGTKIIACKAHYSRWMSGMTGDDLTEPIRVRNYGPDTTCEVVHHGDVCGRGKDDGNGKMSTIVVNGTKIIACSAHYSRWLKGWTGDALTSPIAPRKTLRK
ncbi:MAG: hypothetical protein P8O03_13490, partial [Ilumatobacter sp.]|nr:hypothetical protein [Ilumatobacter sp.]